MANVFPTTPLYHYASLSEFKQILESKSVWLIPVDPPADLNAALAFIKQVVATEYPGISPDLFNLDRSSSYPVYSFSLSSQKDLQSGWAKYNPDSGFSIAIDPGQLSAILNYSNLNLYPCIYDDEGKKNFVISTIIDSPDGLDKDQDRFPEKIKLINRNILNYAGLLKDGSLANEQEWKIIALYAWSAMVSGLTDIPPDPFEVKSGIKNNSPVNYLEASLADEPNKVSLKEVVIGPNPDMPQAKLTCQSLVDESANPESVVITESALPYNP